MLVTAKRRYSGRVIHVDHDTVQFPDGSTGQLEMVRHPGACAIVPFLDDPAEPDPRILLLRQFRHAADSFIWEIPAGTLHPGEEPDACARRELLEESGCTAGSLERMTTVFTTPGFTDERIHLYLACDLGRGDHSPDHDEFISIHEFRWSAVGQMIRSGEIKDAKSLCALMFAHCFMRSSGRVGSGRRTA